MNKPYEEVAKETIKTLPVMNASDMPPWVWGFEDKDDAVKAFTKALHLAHQSGMREMREKVKTTLRLKLEKKKLDTGEIVFDMDRAIEAIDKLEIGDE